jgi:hypothetical protein
MPAAARACNPTHAVQALPAWGATRGPLLGYDLGRKPGGASDGLKAPHPTPEGGRRLTGRLKGLAGPFRRYQTVNLRAMPAPGVLTHPIVCSAHRVRDKLNAAWIG